MALGPKWGKNGPKMAKNGFFGVILLFFRHVWAIFAPFRAEGHFLFFGQSFPIFGFRPVFHSTPGGLTRELSETQTSTKQPQASTKQPQTGTNSRF